MTLPFMSALLLILFLVLPLSQSLRIGHQQLAYCLGTNYDGSIQSTANCQQPIQQPVLPPIEPVFEPQLIQPICYLPRVINPQTKQCECLKETVYNPDTNQCLCPPQKPLWNGKNCVCCPDNMYFDQEEKQCYMCPQGFVHNVGLVKARCQPL